MKIVEPFFTRFRSDLQVAKVLKLHLAPHHFAIRHLLVQRPAAQLLAVQQLQKNRLKLVKNQIESKRIYEIDLIMCVSQIAR